MVKAQIYRGIEFIQISKLPVDQKKSIEGWLNQGMVIKILKEDNQLLSDCIQYKYYADWFQTVFSAAPAENEIQFSANRTTNIKLAIGR